MTDFTGVYPAYSWAMSRHIGPGISKETIYEFVSAIVLFGHQVNYRELIEEHMTQRSLLTPNMRSDNGLKNLWRDYQQILPELGLIVSTRVESRFVKLTPLALMLIEGAIDYDEFMNTQVLRYQYPNGQKRTLSPAVKRKFAEQGVALPSGRIEADVENGVLIRPAILVLRVLIEMTRIGMEPKLSVGEILLGLLPSKTNSDWREALKRVKEVRSGSRSINFADEQNRIRDISEWGRLLGCTEIFHFNNGVVTLSSTSSEFIEKIEKICVDYENESFWIPNSIKEEWSMDWFSYYGNPSFQSRLTILDKDGNSDDTFAGLDDDIEISNTGLVNLKLYDYENYVEREFQDSEVSLSNYVLGRKKLEKSSMLHEEIVFSLARNMHSNGYELSYDANSADLLARKSDEHILFEVKTASQKNLQTRIRLGIGQLSEYRFRYQRQYGIRPQSVLVLSSDFKSSDWFTEYLKFDIKIGLMTRSKSEVFTTVVDLNSIG